MSLLYEKFGPFKRGFDRVCGRQRCFVVMAEELSMSVANHVYAMRQCLPSPKQWAAALLAAGFELYVESVDANQLSKRERKHIQGRDTVVTLITHSDMHEYLSSMLAAAVLCALSDGVLAEGGEPPFIPAQDAIDWARACEPEIVKLMQAEG